jgi:hypothetical protein
MCVDNRKSFPKIVSMKTNYFIFYLFDLYCYFVEREAQDADGARDAEAEGVGRGLRSRTQGLEEPTQAKKTGRNTSLPQLKVLKEKYHFCCLTES